jgi:hypothetical protein
VTNSNSNGLRNELRGARAVRFLIIGAERSSSSESAYAFVGRRWKEM